MKKFTVRPGSKRSAMIAAQQQIINQTLEQTKEFANWMLLEPGNIDQADKQTKISAKYACAKSLLQELEEGRALEQITDDLYEYILLMTQKNITQATAHQRWLLELMAQRGRELDKLDKLVKQGKTNID